MIYFDDQSENYHICIWHCTESLDELYAMLPDDMAVREEAERNFQSPHRIREWVTARVLICSMMGRQVPISYDEQGAPHLPDYEGLDVSISHTGDFVAVAIAEHGVIGIDIEKISEKVERVQSRFLRGDEQAESLEQLIVHWSAKETAFKMLRRTKVNFLQHLFIAPFQMEEKGQFMLKESRTDDEHLLPIHYQVFPSFVLTYSYLAED
jgi:phosphopantetheinyl transferase